MYPIPSVEKLIETKSCRHCSVSFPITDKDLEFYEKVSPVFNGKKYSIPTPTLCPDCRQQRRLSFRNEQKLYKRKCDATGKYIISIYSPDKPYKVYEKDVWKGDVYNPLEYGRDFDFSRSFFDQLRELSLVTPKQSIFGSRSNENSAYTNYCSGMHNCYLVQDSMNNNDCLYGLKVSFSNDCLDCAYVIGSEQCHDCVDCMNCYNIGYSRSSSDCRDSLFLYDCMNCSDCFMCKWLHGKKYHIENREYSAEEYTKQKSEMMQNLNKTMDDFNSFCLDIPNRGIVVNNSEWSTGNNLNNSRNSVYCFDSFDIQDCKYCFRIHTSSDCQDYESWGEHSSLMYEVIGAWANGNNILFSTCAMSGSNNVMYSIFAPGCTNCFWCVDTKDNSYCILNKQYTKDEYEALVPKIIEHMQKIGEWGEFFPSTLSPFGYNETVAHEYYPLSRDVAVQRLYNWSDYESPFPKVEKIIPASKLPDDISAIPDDILNWALECEITKRPYRIVKQELEFYRKHNLPIPKRHPDQRHLDRMALRNPRKLFERKCDKCGKEMITTYSQDRKEIVYCEKCYEKEVVG